MNSYYTELNRCQQFTPKDQFTFSSHWIFFPTKNCNDGDKCAFVDVSSLSSGGDDDDDDDDDSKNVQFELDIDINAIGRATAPPATTTTTTPPNFQSAVDGEQIDIDFYNASDWERLELGVFHPSYKSVMDEGSLELFRKHVQKQLDSAQLWRNEVLGELSNDELDDFPPLVICATDTIPTVNQVLRTRANSENDGEFKFEFDYTNGRSVPGDGRIDFDKAFPSNNTPCKRLSLDSKHSKQMCKQVSGGDWEKIWEEVLNQMNSYSLIQQKSLRGQDKIKQAA